MAIKIGGTTVITDGRQLVNISSGLGVGIQSGGQQVGTGITQLNFTGSGNNIISGSGISTISISGGGGGGTTLLIGSRTGAVAQVPVGSGSTTILLRDGSTALVSISA
jgi:hypothetical protein